MEWVEMAMMSFYSILHVFTIKTSLPRVSSWLVDMTLKILTTWHDICHTTPLCHLLFTVNFVPFKSATAAAWITFCVMPSWILLKEWNHENKSLQFAFLLKSQTKNEMNQLEIPRTAHFGVHGKQDLIRKKEEQKKRTGWFCQPRDHHFQMCLIKFAVGRNLLVLQMNSTAVNSSI